MDKFDVRWFIINRKEQVDCAREITGKFNSVLCDAPIKSGKREVIIACSLLKNIQSSHLYLINLTRRDCKEQVRELECYGIRCYVGIDLRKQCLEAVEYIQRQVIEGRTVYLHIDEADYGTGKFQCFQSLIDSTWGMAGVKHIFYTATPQELLSSDLMLDRVVFKPSNKYIGADYFIDNQMLHESTDFFAINSKGAMVLSEQGIECIKRIDVRAKHYIGVIRLTGTTNSVSNFDIVKSNISSSKSSIRKSLDAQLGKDNYTIRFANKDYSLYWGVQGKNLEGAPAWYDYSSTKPLIIIINQTCTRSTEWAIQPHLAFYHSYKKGKKYVNTVCQADTRMFGYRDTPCHVYTSIPNAFKYLAYGVEWLVESIMSGEPSLPFSSRIGEGEGKNKYYTQFLIEGVTEGLDIFEPNHPINKINRHGRKMVGKDRETPSISYDGHHYPWCNRTSTWGSKEGYGNRGSDLSRNIKDGIFSLSKGHKITFAYVDSPPAVEEWKASYEYIVNQIDPEITKAVKERRRVFVIFHLRPKTDFKTKDSSMYYGLAESESQLSLEL